MKQSAENILREYIQFDDVNQSETIELLPLTIIDAMEEYANQQKRYSEEDMKIAFDSNIKDWISFEEFIEQFKKKQNARYNNV